jgi:hypothetical protein
MNGSFEPNAANLAISDHAWRLRKGDRNESICAGLSFQIFLAPTQRAQAK